MSIDGVSGRTSYIGTSILNLRSQLDDLTQQLASGRVSTTYAGQGANRGFALSLRAQVSSINAYADTSTNVNTRINVANLALQGLVDIGSSVKQAASTSTIVLNNNGQTSGQITAQAAFSNAVSLLNSQSGDRYLFSGRTTDTPATVPADVMLNGTGLQAGLKQLVNERRQADQGVGDMGRLTVSSPPLTTTVTSLGEDGSSFGLKLGAVTSSLTGATVTQPTGSPPSVTVDLGAVNPNDGDTITFNFNLPDGTSESIALTATTKTPPPTGSFLIGADTTATTVNLQAAADAGGPEAERYVAGRRVRDRGVEQFLQCVGHGRRHRRQQPGRYPGADHRRHAALRRRGDRLIGHELCGRRYHHGQRHADHLRRVRRHRQSGQHHRQRAGAADEDRIRSPARARRRRSPAARSRCTAATAKH